MRKEKPEQVDFRSGKVPQWIHEAIQTSFALEVEDAKRAGSLGFMARALVMATMPYKDPKEVVFTRKNGDFSLRMVAGYEGGLPFGIYPRLLMSWLTTEAVQKRSPVIELGDSLGMFLREVMDVRSASGGSRGTYTRVNEQMKRLFGSLITASYNGSLRDRGFILRNVMIADALELHDNWLDVPQPEIEVATPESGRAVRNSLWVPQEQATAGTWRSHVQLNEAFYRELIDNPVPIDLRAYRALRGSPLAMDVYTWLTYRASYTDRRTQPIPWQALMLQFGSNFNQADLGQATRDFKKAFTKALRAVQIVYPDMMVEPSEKGLILLPTKPHIMPIKQVQTKNLENKQSDLF